MTLEELRANYKTEILAIADKYGVSDIRVFGSVARGDAREDSDIDFLVSLEENASMLNIGGFQYDVSRLVSKRVDVVEPQNLHWYVKDKVINESQRI